MLEGQVIPAHPLALTGERQFDERSQRALTRYYHAAGAGGVAVGVHTTQFAIRDAAHGLLRPVLRLAAETLDACDATTGKRCVRVAGVCGRTAQAVFEAAQARELGYHAALLSHAALRRKTDDELARHCETVAREIPLFGFYLQPAAGGRLLSFQFWKRFVEIPNVVAIKIAPFNRYQTLDLMRAVAESGRAGEIALYTGNDDNIVSGLLSAHTIATLHGEVTVRIVGGLLGQWACWTSRESAAEVRLATGDMLTRATDLMTMVYGGPSPSPEIELHRYIKSVIPMKALEFGKNHARTTISADLLTSVEGG